MPLYEYKCVSCGTLFEKIRKFSDPPLTKCEKCGGKLERLLSSPSFQFKGTGWYITDYARKSSGSDSSSSRKSGGSAAEVSSKPAASESSGAKEQPVTTKSKDSKRSTK